MEKLQKLTNELYVSVTDNMTKFFNNKVLDSQEIRNVQTSVITKLMAELVQIEHAQSIKDGRDNIGTVINAFNTHMQKTPVVMFKMKEREQ